jgi:L-ascorbate metabolism protein UlaG (beta-lactamase superfamily)
VTAGSPAPEPTRTVPPAGARVTYLGHASLVIESGADVIVTDPVFSDRVGRVFTKRAMPSTFHPEALGRVAAVLISHGHHDHLDYRSLKRVGTDPPILVPWGLGPHLRLHGFTDVRTVRPWDSVNLGSWRVTAVPARHFGGRLPLVHTSGYQGYVLTGPAGIYFAGDTGLDPMAFHEIGRRFRLDLAVLPIAGAVVPWFRRNHMNSADALAAFAILGARQMVPMHFETFPASFEPAHRPRQQLLDGAARLGIMDRVTVLAEGESVRVPGADRSPEPTAPPVSVGPHGPVPPGLPSQGAPRVE